MHMQRITGANNEWIYSIRGDGETGFFVNKLRYGAVRASGLHTFDDDCITGQTL
jgi:hypothetical protein